MVVLTPAHRLLMHTVSTYILQESCSCLTPSAVKTSALENIVITLFKALLRVFWGALRTIIALKELQDNTFYCLS